MCRIERLNPWKSPFKYWEYGPYRMMLNVKWRWLNKHTILQCNQVITSCDRNQPIGVGIKMIDIMLTIYQVRCTVQGLRMRWPETIRCIIFYGVRINSIRTTRQYRTKQTIHCVWKVVHWIGQHCTTFIGKYHTPPPSRRRIMHPIAI